MNKGCDAGDLEGCLVLAEAYANGTGVPRDSVKAKIRPIKPVRLVLGKGVMYWLSWERRKLHGDKSRLWMQLHCIYSRAT